MKDLKNFIADDLSICPHLDKNSLPKMLEQCLSVAATPAEQDMLLMSTLTAVSACLPQISFLHGRYQRTYHPNLMTFIVAGAASGKGIASLALELVKPLHEMYPIIIPGNTSAPALISQLAEQDGCGYMHESEGSVITDIWRQAACNYNTILRKAAEHEPITLLRKTDDENLTIPSPCLSVLLTGTFSQLGKLVPNAENGLFSRIMPLVIRDRQRFDPKVFIYNKESEKAYSVFRQYGELIADLHERLLGREIRFSLTPQMQISAGTLMQAEYDALILQLGEAFHPTVARMGVNLVRIALILTALRLLGRKHIPDTLVCSEEDFRSAILITSKLLLHAADAFTIQGNCGLTTIPKAQGAYQEETMFAALPAEFTTAEAQQILQSMGVSSATIYRYLEGWLTNGKIEKIKHGYYQKRNSHESLRVSA